MAMKMKMSAMKMAKKSGMKKSAMKKSAMKSMKMGKKGMNAYMKLVVEARKKDLPSFTYNGSTYVKKPNPIAHLAAIYKKK